MTKELKIRRFKSTWHKCWFRFSLRTINPRKPVYVCAILDCVHQSGSNSHMRADVLYNFGPAGGELAIALDGVYRGQNQKTFTWGDVLLWGVVWDRPRKHPPSVKRSPFKRESRLWMWPRLIERVHIPRERDFLNDAPTVNALPFVPTHFRL